MALDDYGSLMQTGMNLIPDVNRQILERAQSASLGAEAQANQAQAAMATQKMSRLQHFQEDIKTFDGSPTGISRLIEKYPEYADELKKGWDVQDEAKKQSDLTSLGEIYSAAAGGNWALAKKLSHARADAERAAGLNDPAYDAALGVMDQAADGDHTQQKVVLNLLGTHIAAVTGPDHFATVYGGLKGGYTLGPGDVRLDDNGQVVGHSPLIKADDGSLYSWDDIMGGKATGSAKPNAQTPPSTVSPAAQTVAATLTSAGLPAPVVAGFLGNFHAEGGYDGAQGDGGSASGIAQWHSDRAATFERVAGKPVTEATPEEQAKFVAWEMKNPKAAGMTVAQRDAIMAAKTPSQAAALIDRFYERSSGTDRKKRMAAAEAFAGQSGSTTGPTPLLGGKPKDAPSGYRFKADGSLEAIPGGPADKTGGVALAPGNTDLSGPDYIGDLRKTNPSLANQVQGVLDTRLAYPPATARTPQAQQLRAAVLQADPTYDEQAYKRRQTTIQQYTPGHAGPGQSMLSAATLINHMYDLAQAARELPDHTFAFQNSLSALGAKATNQQWLIKYNEGRKFVASELPKFLEGKAPTEGQVSQHYDSYDPSKGKSGIQAALSTDVDYLYGRYQPLLQAYKDNVGKDLKLDTYAPGQVTAAKAAALEYYRANGALPVVVTNPAQAAKLPHGAIFATPDGRVLRRH